MLILTAAAAGASKAAELDGDLIAICAAYVEAWTAARQEWQDADEEGRRAMSHASATATIHGRPSDNPQWRRAVAISRIPARTPEGIQAKAQVVQTWLRDCGAEWEPRTSSDALHRRSMVAGV